MKVILFITALFLVNQSFGQSAKEAEVLSLSNAKFRYMTSGHLDSLSTVLDDKIVFQHANGMIQNKVEYLNTLTSGRLKYNSVDVKEEKVTVVDNTAFVLGKCSFNVTFEGQIKNFNFSFTEVYSLHKRKWKMILYSVK
jgi:hypothetical protein